MDPPPPPTTDSATSSPRHDTTWDDNPLPPVPGSKLRLMCSYGGHIIPRPHDKSLCYIGGDTRIVVVDRLTALADLHSRLSHTLLNGRNFTLKYQLPSEDLDSLISLASDEDLDNMIEEYDCSTAAASPLKPSRLRLFLFPSKPETAASMGSLLDDAKSQTWFVDAFNGSGLLPRGLSESAAIDTMLEAELDGGGSITNSDSCADLAAQNEQSFGYGKQVPAKNSNAQEPVVETSSSFGSSSSSTTMANLPPFKVRGEDYNMMVGLDEQFSSHLSIAPKSEKSDHGTVAPTVLRKRPPLPLQTVQRKHVDIHNLPSPDSKHPGGYSLPSPDSVASDCSMASGGSLSKHAIYHDSTQPVTRVTTSVNEPNMMMNQDPNPSSQNNIQAADSSIPSPQFSQQQYIPNTHYLQSAMPISSYYTMYLHHQTQQNDQQQQYPMYMLSPQTPTQPTATSSRTITPPLPPVYPTKTDQMPMMIQVPTHQFQQHYIGVQQQQQQQPQSIPNAAAAPGGGNYGYECSHLLQQDQAYYAQHMAATSAPPPPQYQTMTPVTAVMFSQPSPQITSDTNPQHS